MFVKTKVCRLIEALVVEQFIRTFWNKPHHALFNIFIKTHFMYSCLWLFVCVFINIHTNVIISKSYNKKIVIKKKSIENGWMSPETNNMQRK